MENYQLQPVFWYEGQFVRPHHFQIQDQHQKDYVYGLCSILIPNTWGISRLEYSVALLKSNFLEFSECWVMFPDGTFLKYPGNSSLYRRSLSEILPDEGERLSIYLALSKYGVQEIENDVSEMNSMLAPESKKTVRYGIARKPQENLYDGANSEEVATLELQCQILTQEELSKTSDCVAIKIMELVRQGNKMMPVHDYIPPCIAVSGVSALEALVSGMRNDLAARAHHFNRRKAKLFQEGSEAEFQAIVTLEAHMALNRAVSAIDHLLEMKVSGPWMFYGVLRMLYAELSACDFSGGLSGKPVNKSFRYYHEDIFGCFENMSQQLTALLDKYNDSEEVVLAMKYDGTYYSTPVENESLLPDKKKILRIRAGKGQIGAIKVLSRTAKVSSREYLPLLIARSLPGVDISYLNAPTVYQSHSHDFHYFSLEQQGVAWEHVMQDGNLALFTDNLQEPLEVALVTVNDN